MLTHCEAQQVGCLYFHHYRNGILRYPNSPLRVPPAHSPYRVRSIFALCLLYVYNITLLMHMSAHSPFEHYITLYTHLLDDNDQGND